MKASTAKDKVHLGDKWKGKMKRYEKLKKCIKNLINNNVEDLRTFDMSEITDSESHL